MEIGLGAMGMRSDDFWRQSIGEWDARIAGFSELHGGARQDDPFTADDLERLEAEVDAEAAQHSAPGRPQPTL
jgi:hypothetical protein